MKTRGITCNLLVLVLTGILVACSGSNTSIPSHPPTPTPKPLSVSDTSAIAILGQPNFTNPTCNNPGLTNSQQLCHPVGIALDNRSGRLFVADGDNNRVLMFTPPLTSDPGADRVFGEPNFTTSACKTGASGLCAPHRVAVNASGQLIVSDSDNNRVLVYSHPMSSSSADIVFGQPNFTSHTPTTSATGLAGPQGIATDLHGNLYLTDEDNNRVLRYDAH